MDKPKFSLVIPVYNEEQSIEPLVESIFKVIREEDFEVIFVNDGSTDNTASFLGQLAKDHPSLRILSLKANSGQGRAFYEGIIASQGSTIITMDGDLQNDPSDIPVLLKKLDQGFDLVCGWRVERNDTTVKKLKSRIANFFQGAITGLSLHDMSCSIKAFRKNVFEGVEFKGKYDFCFLPLLAMQHKKIRIAEVPVKDNRREHGQTKYKTIPVILGTIYDYFSLLWRLNRFKK